MCCVSACVCVCYLQLSPRVRKVVYLAVEVGGQLGGAPLQGLGSAQQARLLALHQQQLGVAALQNDSRKTDSRHSDRHTKYKTQRTATRRPFTETCRQHSICKDQSGKRQRHL